MQALRWVEAASGLFASVIGGAFIVRLSAGPQQVIASNVGCQGASQGSPICVDVTEQSITPTLAQAHSLPAAIMLLIIVVLLVAITCAALWHSLTGRLAARWTLWGCAGAFVLLAVWAMVSIGVFLAPSVALVLVASLCAVAVRGPATL